MARPQGITKPVPADFAAMAIGMTASDLRQHFGVHSRTIKRWAMESGVEVTRIFNRPCQKRPVPDDFAQVAPTMTLAELRAHYRVSKSALSRWQAETGIKSSNRRPVRVVHHRPQKPIFKFGGHSAMPITRDLRPCTMFDQAADVLRRERFVVYRCNDRGRYDEKGEFWRLGNTLLTPDDLLIRAKKYQGVAA